MNQGYGAKRINFRHPPLGANVARIGGGVMIVVLVAWGATHVYSLVLEYFAYSRHTGLINESVFSFAVYWAPVVFLVIGGKWFWPALKAGLDTIYDGWLALMRVEMPAYCPKDFRQTPNNKTATCDYDFEALRRHAVPVYEHFDERHKYLTAVFGRNSLFLSPTRRQVVQRNGDSLKKRAKTLVFLAIIYGMLWWGSNWLRSNISNLPLGDLIEYVTRPMEEWVQSPLLWLIGLNLLIGAVEFATSFMLVPSSQPDSVPYELSENYRGFGHPLQVINRLPELSTKLAWEDFPNRCVRLRDLRDTHPVGVTDTATFNVSLFIEQQPRPVPDNDLVPSYLMLVAGWLICLGGVYTYFFHVIPDLARWELFFNMGVGYLFTVPIYTGLMLALATTAMAGWLNLVINAEGLFNSARFTSMGILIDFEGSLARSDVRVGKAMMDSVESSNVAVRSDFVARFWAAELVSETPVLDEERCLLEAYQTPESEQWAHFFRDQIYQLRDEGVKILGVDLQATEVSEVIRTNIATAQLRGTVASTPRLTHGRNSESRLLGRATSHPASGDSTEAPPDEVHPAPGNYDPTAWKECPECAELVRSKAKKCRFCGYIFTS